MAFNLTTDDHISVAIATVACFLVLLGHAGFALYETGLARAKNASHAMATNGIAWAVAAMAFVVSGFALLCGAALPSAGLDRWLLHAGSWGFISGKGFFLAGIRQDHVGAWLLMLAMMCRVTIAATLPSGALAERWRFKNFLTFSALLSAVVIPIYGSWIWGGGWLSRLAMGHGAIDYAGSSVIHLQGGVIALLGVWLLGPRIGKFDARRRPRPILGHHIPMAVLGCLIITLSLLALNTVPALAANDGHVVIAALNSVTAAAAGATMSCTVMIWRFGKPDPTMICNGTLAGVAAIAASCPLVQPGAALFIGAVAGLLTIWSVGFLEHRGLDDPAGVISVHGIGGLWGMIAAGLLADGFAVGVDGRPIAGLFYGDGRQLLAQIVAVMACTTWGLLAGGITFYIVGKFFGPHRVPPEVESNGLDIAEVGVPAYQELLNPISSATRFMVEPRPAAAPANVGNSRFSIVVEGIDSNTLISVWSGLCQAGNEPSDAFNNVYPYLTTVTGNRFRFRGGDSGRIRDNLRSLFESVLPDRSVSTRIES